MRTPAGDRVTVQGRVRTVDGRVTLGPSLPTGIDDHTGRRIIVRGEFTAAEGSHVSVDGTLDGDELTVLGWAADPGPDELYRFLRGVEGVRRGDLPETDDIVAEADVIGVGGGRGSSGGWWSIIHAARPRRSRRGSRTSCPGRCTCTDSYGMRACRR